MESFLALLIITVYIPHSGAILGAVSFMKVQVVSWLFVFRFKSIGTYFKHEEYIILIPIVSGVAQVPIVVILGLSSSFEEYLNNYSCYLISASVLFIIISGLEIVMNLALLRKLKFILEHKPGATRKMFCRIRFISVLIVLMEFVLCFARCIVTIDNVANPIIYAVRIYVIILFYDDLLNALDTNNSQESLTFPSIDNV